MRLGLTGNAGLGKSAAAEFVRSRYGFVRLSFAFRMKEFFTEIIRVPLDKRFHRVALQMFGTDVFRSIDKEVWVRWLAHDLALLPDTASVVVDDVRFDNEAEFLRANGFTIVRIEGRKKKLSEIEMRHESERGIDARLIDYTILNDGYFTQFYQKVVDIIRLIATEKNDLSFAVM